MNKRRMFFVLLGLSGLMLLLWGRLVSVQVLQTSRFSRHGIDLAGNSVYQRQQALVLDSGRGDFYDRENRPITGETYPALLMFPVNRSMEQWKVEWDIFYKLTHSNAADWSAYERSVTVPRFWTEKDSAEPKRLTDDQARLIRGLQIPGLVVVDYRQRYLSPFPAAQLIGFLSQDPERTKREFAGKLEQGRLTVGSRIGGGGLEKTFEPFLSGIGPRTLSLFTDSQQRPIAGLGLRETEPGNPFYPLKATLTIDLSLQGAVERQMEQMNIREGAVVVLDAETADVVAMASRPAFDPNLVDPAAGNWSNRALRATVPGSIFKTVVAAAALDAGVVRPDEKFHCDGELGKYGFSCWLPGGHGDITFAEAFAQSCNITFAKVMERLSSDTLEKTSKQLGLLQQVGWAGKVPGHSSFKQLDREDAGQLFAQGTSRTDDGVRVQTSIGQRDVRLTPLQAANMVVTILHDGEVMRPTIVQELDYQNGRPFYKFAPHIIVKRGDGIPATTAKRLRVWMRSVVDHGTGQALGRAVWPLAGKSGTAQEGTTDNNTVTQWFVGYGPYSHPRYTTAVVVEHTRPGQEGQAVALFRTVMDLLASADYAKQDSGK